MKEIGIREFKNNFYASLEAVPVVITKYGRPQFVVHNFKDSQTPVKSETENVAHNSNPARTGSDRSDVDHNGVNVDHNEKVDHNKADVDHKETCQIEGCENPGTPCRIDREQDAILCKKHFKIFSKNHRVIRI